jgi:transcriptional regulator with XRE-family HTH domain
MDLSPEVAREFGLNMLLARKRADLSQEELGFRASLHRTEISQLERGVRLPRIDTVVKLAGALSVPPGDLLKGVAWTPGTQRLGRFRVRSDPADRPRPKGLRARPASTPARPQATGVNDAEPGGCGLAASTWTTSRTTVSVGARRCSITAASWSAC